MTWLWTNWLTLAQIALVASGSFVLMFFLSQRLA